MYRTSLISISKVNKTDVETLKTNIGSISYIAGASSDKMQLLPGLGRVKVRRIKDAFEKPFYPHVATSITSEETTERRPHFQGLRGGSPILDAHDPEKVVERHISPVWDIEMDLNPSDGVDTPEETDKNHEVTKPRPVDKSAREPSPIWDIELDLNPSDEEVDTPEETDGDHEFIKPRSVEKIPREPSPTWDIEHDLGNSDIDSIDSQVPSKKGRR